MHNSELTDRIADGTLSRRRLSQLLATVGLAAVAIPVAGRSVHAEEQAVYFTWSVYNDPEARYRSDKVYMDFARSARNAVNLSSPLALPPGGYEIARDIVVEFDPRQVLQ